MAAGKGSGLSEKRFKRVGTHNGRFHADEVMSTALLKELYDVEVVRSRDPDVLSRLDLIYDVGEGEFDHHQPDGRSRENGTPYAACGLIWERFGREIVRSFDGSLAEPEADRIFREIDRRLIEGIDAADNGIRTFRTIIPTLSISNAISKFNPTWDSPVSEDSAFEEAVRMASSVFRNVMKQILSVERAREYVRSAYASRDVRELLMLDRNYPWNELVYDVDRDNELLYVIYPDNGRYMLQTVRRRNGRSPEGKLLPASWAGKRDGELAAVTGVQDAVFCHSHRFIAGAGSPEGIMRLAELALVEPEETVEREYWPALKLLRSLTGFWKHGRIRIRLR